MRLVNCHTLKLEEFFGRPTPPYYILSHRWTNDEISYQDFRKHRRMESKGYKKVVDCCRFVLDPHQTDIGHATSNTLAQQDQAREAVSDSPAACDPETLLSEVCYVWIDTCCIDKKSSAELSEAINSMYQYYANAIRCYVFLSDVTYAQGLQNLENAGLMDGQLHTSGWFTRGWTLQELLAPPAVVFLNDAWQVIGHKCRRPRTCTSGMYHNIGDHSGVILNHHIARITGIDAVFLAMPSKIQSASIAKRMSWASKRSTTRIEDVAYCLLGLFGVNMPLLYGEGKTAFFRLQEELIKRSTDQSIFAWTLNKAEHAHLPNSARVSGIFARSPADFEYSGNILSTDVETWPYTITNTGLHIHAMARKWSMPDSLHQSRAHVHIINLNCVVVVNMGGGRSEYRLAKIALIESHSPFTSLSDQLQNYFLAPVRLFERLHDMDDLFQESTAMGDPQHVQIYVKTFDQAVFLFKSDVDSQ